jgi:hypothetical protein
VRHANRLLEKGIAYHPLDWRNRFYLGTTCSSTWRTTRSAADALESAVAFPDAPDYLGSFVTRLRASSDGLDTAVLFLQQLIAQTEDEYARAEYLETLDEIETERRAPAARPRPRRVPAAQRPRHRGARRALGPGRCACSTARRPRIPRSPDSAG